MKRDFIFVKTKASRQFTPIKSREKIFIIPDKPLSEMTDEELKIFRESIREIKREKMRDNLEKAIKKLEEESKSWTIDQQVRAEQRLKEYELEAKEAGMPEKEIEKYKPLLLEIAKNDIRTEDEALKTGVDSYNILKSLEERKKKYPEFYKELDEFRKTIGSSKQLGWPIPIFKKGDRVIYDNPNSFKLGKLGRIIGTKGEYLLIKLDDGKVIKTRSIYIKKPLLTLYGKKQWR